MCKGLNNGTVCLANTFSTDDRLLTHHKLCLCCVMLRHVQPPLAPPSAFLRGQRSRAYSLSELEGEPGNEARIKAVRGIHMIE